MSAYVAKEKVDALAPLGFDPVKMLNALHAAVSVCVCVCVCFFFPASLFSSPFMVSLAYPQFLLPSLFFLFLV